MLPATPPVTGSRATDPRTIARANSPMDSSYVTLVQRARKAFDDHAWNDAAELWRSALLVDDRVGAHWLAMADAMYHAQRYREAVSAYERSIQLGALSAGDGGWKVARSYAQLGNAKQAARWVELARRARRAESRRKTSDDARDPRASLRVRLTSLAVRVTVEVAQLPQLPV
jgi:tetratricopeptide (TPR) repeat protein